MQSQSWVGFHPATSLEVASPARPTLESLDIIKCNKLWTPPPLCGIFQQIYQRISSPSPSFLNPPPKRNNRSFTMVKHRGFGQGIAIGSHRCLCVTSPWRGQTNGQGLCFSAPVFARMARNSNYNWTAAADLNFLSLPDFFLNLRNRRRFIII